MCVFKGLKKGLNMKDIKNNIKKYDSQLDYISGYENCYSLVKCYCHRCNNYFERKWCNIARHNTEYCCPICQTKLGLQKSKENYKQPPTQPLEDRKLHFIKRLNEKYPNFEYVGGYVNSECKVLLKCKKCGELLTKKSSCIRGKKKLTCFNCMKLETSKRKEIKKYLKELECNYKKEQNKLLRNISKKIKNNTLLIKHCRECGNEIITRYIQKEICSKCISRKNYKHHSNKSLQQLYERDKGICYICNKKCDYEDYVYRGNTFIAGNYYPSIDHVIPLCKGGTDEWDNLKLAHRICNSYKSKKDILSFPYEENT